MEFHPHIHKFVDEFGRNYELNMKTIYMEYLKKRAESSKEQQKLGGLQT